jgi:hypothetical protein
VRAQESNLPQQDRGCLLPRLFILACIAAALWAFPPFASAQEMPGQPQEEVVANLAAGRVVIAVVKDAILIGTIENPVEAQTRTPIPTQITSERVGIVLGADQWFSPSSHQEFARLDKELPHLRRETAPTTPRLQPSQAGQEATDIQAVGQGVLERLNEVAPRLHTNINWPQGEPIVELILAGYLPAYGPEVWQLTYGIEQAPEHGEYWSTRVLRPRLLQIWPPEKGEPHTLVEFVYPPSDASPSLMDLLRKKDPRLEAICASDSKMREIAGRLLAGESGKITATDTLQFLRAAFNVIAPPNTHQTMAVLSVEKGFEWILAPPPEPKGPVQEKPREPGAPTLLKPPSR